MFRSIGILLAQPYNAAIDSQYILSPATGCLVLFYTLPDYSGRTPEKRGGKVGEGNFSLLLATQPLSLWEQFWMFLLLFKKYYLSCFMVDVSQLLVTLKDVSYQCIYNRGGRRQITVTQACRLAQNNISLFRVKLSSYRNYSILAKMPNLADTYHYQGILYVAKL